MNTSRSNAKVGIWPPTTDPCPLPFLSHRQTPISSGLAAAPAPHPLAAPPIAIAIAITQSSCAPSRRCSVPIGSLTNVLSSPSSRGLRNSSGSAISIAARFSIIAGRVTTDVNHPSCPPWDKDSRSACPSDAPALRIHDYSAPPPPTHSRTAAPARPLAAPTHTEENAHATPRTAIPWCRSITCAHA